MAALESSQASSLDQRLLLEGWSLSQRLIYIANHVQHADDDNPTDDLLRRWRQVISPYNHEYFDKRLKWDSISPDTAALALQPPPEYCPTNPAWWFILSSIRQVTNERFDLTGLNERCVDEPFVHAWRPAAAWALQKLQERCYELQPLLLLSPEAWLDLAEALLVRLCNTAGHALWEKFNERRTPGQILIAHLGARGDGSGVPIHEVYDDFIAELLSSGYGLLLNDFPVLGRLQSTVIELWLDGTAEMLERIASSRMELQQYFGIFPGSILHKVQMGLSDPHRGGRAVAIICFDNETASDLTRVVYKPKDLQLDRAYQDFLRTLNHSSTMSPLRTVMVLARDGYGFMEWVEHRPCRTDEELARFYTNAGRHLGVLHLLGCNDCHHENLIASNDQLILIDSETLFNPSLVDVDSGDADTQHLLSSLQISMEDSVLRIGLLPHWTIEGAGRKNAFDVSALGIVPTPEREMPGWMAINSDGMMSCSIMKSCELPTSLPVTMGSSQRLTDFIDQLCAGFTQQLLEALNLSSILIETISRFKGLPRRVLARNTRLYFAIQQQMLTPASLRSSVAHGLVLEKLSRCFLPVNKKPNSWPMFQAEMLQMEQLDIPLFEHLIDNDDLPLPHGMVPIRGYWLASGLESAKRRLIELDCDEISFQEQLIRGAINARQLKPDQRGDEAGSINDSSSPQLTDEPSCILSADDYRHEAFRLGEELWIDSVRDRKGRPEWLGIDLGTDGESFKFGLVGNSLYSGSTGIALLFERLALSSHDPAVSACWHERAWSCFARLAELGEGNSMNPLFRKLAYLPYGLHGAGGTLLALQLLSKSGSTQAAQLAEKIVLQLRPGLLQADESFDVLSGVAGLIGPLLLLGSPQALDIASICGNRLLELQLVSGGWVSSAGHASHSRPALTGFSHGAAGIAAALARLAQVTGVHRFAEAARRAVAYEREVFVSDKGNWPDFRNSSKPIDFMMSWCHGAPGILLSRQVLQAAGLADDKTEFEIHIARNSMLANLASLNCSTGNPPAHLCCGVLGLTSLLRIVDGTNGVILDPVVPHTEGLLVSKARVNGGYKFLGVGSGMHNLPGLLSGKAGVALALLEAGEGLHWIPQVLCAGLHALP